MSDDGQQPQPVTERIPGPSLVGSPVVLPDVRRKANEAAPQVRPTRQRYTRPRTREAERRAERGDRRPVRSDAKSALPPRLAGSFVAQDAAMLSMSQPHSLAMLWAHQRACAEWYEAGLLRWPRYAFGGFAIVVAAAVYLAVWWLAPLSRALATAALIALWVWWPF